MSYPAGRQDSTEPSTSQTSLHGTDAGHTNVEFFLSNYRLGKTLGIGSFGKVPYTYFL